MREALEAALAAEPDDLGVHKAYADFLIEQGDPRGEFIAVQLALEDPSRSTAERNRLRKREKELLKSHESQWLGELASVLLISPDEQRALYAAESHYDEDVPEPIYFRHSWARGWLDRFECYELPAEVARNLGRCPAARFLRTLICRRGEYENVFHVQRDNLREFQYGQEVDPEEYRYDSGTQYGELAPLIATMPCLEELSIFGHIYMDDEMWQDMNQILSLPTLTNLRVYRHYHGTTYALEPLATNPALGRLSHLLLFPHGFSRSFDPRHLGTDAWLGQRQRPALHRDNVRLIFTSPHLRSLTHLQLRGCSGGDAMIADLVKSGLLNRLKWLDLRHGLITDEGARRLAACPETKNLEMLDLTNNRLTKKGVSQLRAARIPVRADDQHAGEDENFILYCGDSE